MTTPVIQRYEKTAKLSRVVVHQGTAHLSGLTAADKSVGIKGQTEQILARADALLASIGSNKSQLLYVQIWLKDISDFDAMNEVWLDWIDADAPPARATVQSSMALPEILIEVQIVAAV